MRLWSDQARQLSCSSAKQRAREVVEWRAYAEDQEKVQKDLEIIEAKQKEHKDAYKKEREGLTNLTWKQRRAALYKAKRHLMAARPKERMESDKNTLPVIVKGEGLFYCLFCAGAQSYNIALEFWGPDPHNIIHPGPTLGLVLAPLW